MLTQLFQGLYRARHLLNGLILHTESKGYTARYRITPKAVAHPTKQDRHQSAVSQHHTILRTKPSEPVLNHRCLPGFAGATPVDLPLYYILQHHSVHVPILNTPLGRRATTLTRTVMTSPRVRKSQSRHPIYHTPQKTKVRKKVRTQCHWGIRTHAKIVGKNPVESFWPKRALILPGCSRPFSRVFLANGWANRLENTRKMPIPGLRPERKKIPRHSTGLHNRRLDHCCQQ